VLSKTPTIFCSSIRARPDNPPSTNLFRAKGDQIQYVHETIICATRNCGRNSRLLADASMAGYVVDLLGYKSRLLVLSSNERTLRVMHGVMSY
jgi:hypothetical protein